MKTIFLDIDGTCVDFDTDPKNVAPSFDNREKLIRLINELTAQGHRVAFITGRPFEAVKEIFSHIKHADGTIEKTKTEFPWEKVDISVNHGLQVHWQNQTVSTLLDKKTFSTLEKAFSSEIATPIFNEIKSELMTALNWNEAKAQDFFSNNMCERKIVRQKNASENTTFELIVIHYKRLKETLKAHFKDLPEKQLNEQIEKHLTPIKNQVSAKYNELLNAYGLNTDTSEDATEVEIKASDKGVALKALVKREEESGQTVDHIHFSGDELFKVNTKGDITSFATDFQALKAMMELKKECTDFKLSFIQPQHPGTQWLRIGLKDADWQEKIDAFLKEKDMTFRIKDILELVDYEAVEFADGHVRGLMGKFGAQSKPSGNPAAFHQPAAEAPAPEAPRPAI